MKKEIFCVFVGLCKCHIFFKIIFWKLNNMSFLVIFFLVIICHQCSDSTKKNSSFHSHLQIQRYYCVFTDKRKDWRKMKKLSSFSFLQGVKKMMTVFFPLFQNHFKLKEVLLFFSFFLFLNIPSSFIFRFKKNTKCNAY